MPKQYEYKIESKTWTRILFLFFFSYSTMNGFVIAVIQKIPVFGVALALISIPLIVVCLLVLSVREGSFRYCRKSDFLFLMIIFVLIIFSGIPDISRLSSFVFYVLPAYYIGVNFVDDDKTMAWLEYCAALSITINTPYYMQAYSGLGIRYDMARAYSILPHVLVVINAIYRNKNPLKLIYFLCGIIGIFYLSVLGARGPLAIVFVYLIVNTLLKSKGSIKFKILFMLFILVVGIIWISGYYLIITQKLLVIISGMGLPTRALDLLLSGEYLSHASGRDVILDKAIEMIQNKPILGYGLWGQYEELGTYPHNYFIEVLLHVGIPFGAVVIISFFTIVITAYFSCSSDNVKTLIVLLAVSTILKGLASGSYLDDELLFLLVGICIYAKRCLRSDYEYKKNAFDGV